MWTLNDIENQEKQREEIQANWNSSESSMNRNGVHTIDNTFYNPIKIGKESLELTNQFRSQQKLPPLKWHQKLCEIGAKHSKGKRRIATEFLTNFEDMGDGKVPFGHDGFDDRVKQYPFHANGAAENVAMNSGISEIARVSSWIKFA